MTTRAEARRQAVEARDSGSPGVLLDPSFVLELLDEQQGREVEELRTRAARARQKLGPTVHVLKGGNALCGLPGSQLDGRSGHIWVQMNAMVAHVVSCGECRRALGVALMLEKGTR